MRKYVTNAFSADLDEYVKQARLPLRRIASRAEIPHQTLFNWLNGVQPRWHPALADDLRRLAHALGLDGAETDQLLQSAGCLPARTMRRHTKGHAMNASPAVPKHWFLAGSHPGHYETGVVPAGTGGAERSALLRARNSSAGFGTLMQVIDAAAYRGRRLRLSAHVRSRGVAQWAGLWMRVDGADQGEILAFDNMQSRPIFGTTDWTIHSVVLDVAEAAERIAFGVLRAGPGEVHTAGIALSPVGADVPTSSDGLVYPSEPMNLSFAE